jgi:hypothetical protein
MRNKFMFKASLVALALFASSNANALSYSSGGELFLVAYDSTLTQEKTFIAALGSSVTGFNPNASTSFDFSADSNWTSLSPNLANTKFSVVGIDTTSTFIYTTGGGRFTTTGNVIYSNNTVNTLFNNLAGVSSANNFMANATSALGNGDVTGTSTKKVLGTADASGATLGFKLFNTAGSGLDTQVLVGSNNAFYSLDPTSISGNASVAKSALLGNWNLSSGGALTYVAAVPEADVSLMMISGLAMIGFIAGRRKA